MSTQEFPKSGSSNQTEESHEGLDIESDAESVTNRLASLHIKRSKAAVEVHQWDLALEDANMAIELAPASPLAHERRDAVQYAKTELERSGLRTRAEKKEAIRLSIREVIKDWPPMLINTRTGRGCNRQQQELAFEDISPFKEYLSSDTTTSQLRKSLVMGMKKYCRYVMLSHAWEGEESIFDLIATRSLYDLSTPSYIDKLQRFCDVVREAGCYWAWSDSSCISLVGHGQIVEEPRSSYDWYEHAWRTIVLLRGMQKSSLPASIKNSIWITRSWTIYEYVAARYIWFYTDEWKPYRDLGNSNHKYVPIVVAEIQEVTKVSPETHHKLGAGVNDVRVKLQLAALRNVTKPEDTAYSLCPLFDTPLEPRYGEGTEYAVGRLFEQVITRSGDVVVLDWIGNAGTYNSCLPCDLRPYSAAQCHEPSPVVNIPAHFPELDTGAILLYKRLAALEPPRMSDKRLRLPCIAFHVESIQIADTSVYRLKMRGLGDAEVKTTDDLVMTSKNLLLIHPWIRTLLGSITDPTIHPEGEDENRRTEGLQLAARLRQDFGALLLTEGPQNEYKRVAADVSIRVQLLEGTSFAQLLDNVRVLDVV